MAYIFSFLFCGFVCAIAQLIYDKTKFSPGHITSLFVLIGILLEAFGVYSILIENLPGGASLPILNFGYLLASSVRKGIIEYGFIGIFKNMFVPVSGSLSVVIVSGAVAGFIKKLLS